MFYDPSPEILARLNQPWCASYSGGKDSTGLATWLESLRRRGLVRIKRPRLVQSNTTVEYPLLEAISRDMMALLTASGWECVVVTPKIDQKLYNRILGVGLQPIHPGNSQLRWCTRSTKTDPMTRWNKANGGGLMLTGLRWKESNKRDAKMEAITCSVGGECGIPLPSKNTYSPIATWTTCQLIDWLSGHECRTGMADVFAITKKLVDIYEFEFPDAALGDWASKEISSARFGCCGCPAISAEPTAPRREYERNGHNSPLNEIYAVWFDARLPMNRLRKVKNMRGGPIKMAVRKILFERIIDIQRRAGYVLVTPEDEAFIRNCWERQVYPRGWSAADELTSDALADQYDTPLLQCTVGGAKI